MANSGTVTAGSAALASQYNNLRDDVLNVSTGHTHTGASENGAKVAATGVSSGTAALGAVLSADGSGGASFAVLAAAGADVQEFTSSGSWVKPAGKSAVYVLAVGGGGGGASGRRDDAAHGYGGSGGDGAQPAVQWLTASSLAGTVTVTIGAGGAGGTGVASGTNNASGGTGLPGGNTTFGSHLLSIGGWGGILESNDTRILVPIGNAEWGYTASLSNVATGGTTDASGFSPSLGIAEAITRRYLMPGVGAMFSSRNAVRAHFKCGGGGAGGGNGSATTGGGAGARGLGSGGTVPDGGAAGSAGTAALVGTAGSVTAMVGGGGGGGGGGSNANGGAGGAGYLGGGGGGAGGVGVSAGSAARSVGAGGAGGGGYVLVISV